MTDNGTPAWMDQLPDDLKGNENLTQFETIGDLGTKFLELEGRSADALFIPGEDASDDDRATFFQRLGRPADPKEYDLSLPEGFPEKMGPTEDEDREYRDILHRLGITGTQAKGLYDYAMGKAKSNLETIEAQREKYRSDNETVLKREWGDQYDANVTKANKVIDKLGTDGFKDYLKATQMGNWAELARFLVKVHDVVGDDEFVDAEITGPDGGDSRPRGPDGRPRFSYDTK